MTEFARTCGHCAGLFLCNDPTSCVWYCNRCRRKVLKPFDEWAANLNTGDRVYVQPYLAWHGLSRSQYFVVAQDGDMLTVQIPGLPDSRQTLNVAHLCQHDATPRTRRPNRTILQEQPTMTTTDPTTTDKPNPTVEAIFHALVETAYLDEIRTRNAAERLVTYHGVVDRETHNAAVKREVEWGWHIAEHRDRLDTELHKLKRLLNLSSLGRVQAISWLVRDLHPSRTAKHDDTCWQRHTGCLAHAIDQILDDPQYDAVDYKNPQP